VLNPIFSRRRRQPEGQQQTLQRRGGEQARRRRICTSRADAARQLIHFFGAPEQRRGVLAIRMFMLRWARTVQRRHKI
jgi:hypothetical protein